jgi:predicted regulator of Ras-like GTPase activity (Roadblock/LC7/MglB family)
MAFFWNLFKQKPLEFPSHSVPEESGEIERAESRTHAAHESAAARAAAIKVVATPPMTRKISFAGGGHGPPARAEKHAPAAVHVPDEEIVLELGDVLARIPARFLKPGPHDPKCELRFKVQDIFPAITRGKATVPLSQIAKLCPGIFRGELELTEDIPVTLPLQKLVEQVGSSHPWHAHAHAHAHAHEHEHTDAHTHHAHEEKVVRHEPHPPAGIGTKREHIPDAKTPPHSKVSEPAEPPASSTASFSAPPVASASTTPATGFAETPLRFESHTSTPAAGAGAEQNLPVPQPAEPPVIGSTAEPADRKKADEPGAVAPVVEKAIEAVPDKPPEERAAVHAGAGPSAAEIPAPQPSPVAPPRVGTEMVAPPRLRPVFVTPPRLFGNEPPIARPATAAPPTAAPVEVPPAIAPTEVPPAETGGARPTRASAEPPPGARAETTPAAVESAAQKAASAPPEIPHAAAARVPEPPATPIEPHTTPAPNASNPLPAQPSPPPHEPSLAFDPSNLRNLLLTDEVLDLPTIAKLVAQFPGIGGCALISKGALAVSGELPQQFDARSFGEHAAGFLNSIHTGAGTLKFGKIHAVAFHYESRMATCFVQRDACLCVFHDDFGLLPGYREKLSTVIAEVARM